RAGHAGRVLRDRLRAGAGQAGRPAVQQEELARVRLRGDGLVRRTDRQVGFPVLVHAAGRQRVAELVAGRGRLRYVVAVLRDRVRRAEGDVGVALVDRHVAADTVALVGAADRD